MKNQKWSKGALCEISLPNGQKSQCQMLSSPEFAFFDPSDPEKVLFRLYVMRYAYSKGRWIKIGKRRLLPDLDSPVPRFLQDAITGKLSITFGGLEETPATYEQCKDLERCAVWDPEHVESRLQDYLDGKENIWVKNLEIDQSKL